MANVQAVPRAQVLPVAVSGLKVLASSASGTKAPETEAKIRRQHDKIRVQAI